MKTLPEATDLGVPPRRAFSGVFFFFFFFFFLCSLCAEQFCAGGSVSVQHEREQETERVMTAEAMLSAPFCMIYRGGSWS